MIKSPLIYHGVMLMKTEKRSTPPAGGGRCVTDKHMPVMNSKIPV